MMALILFIIGLILRNNKDVGPTARVVGKIMFWVGLGLIIVFTLITIVMIISAGLAVMAACA